MRGADAQGMNMYYATTAISGYRLRLVIHCSTLCLHTFRSEGSSSGRPRASSTFVVRSTGLADDYDDIVKWVSPNVLFGKMIEAYQLP